MKLSNLKAALVLSEKRSLLLEAKAELATMSEWSSVRMSIRCLTGPDVHFVAPEKELRDFVERLIAINLSELAKIGVEL